MDMMQHAQQDLQYAKQMSGECSVEHAPCAAKQGWKDQTRCLVDAGPERVKSIRCKEAVPALAQIYPSALFAENGGLGAGAPPNIGCNATADANPYVWSYHIHIQWDEWTDPSSRNTSDAFADLFVKTWAPDVQMCAPYSFLTSLWNQDSVDQSKHNFADICAFQVFPPGGPFLHHNRGWMITPPDLHKILPWLAQNRPLDDKLTIFIHPNTGCQYNDLRHFSMWVGPSEELFYDILLGCVWAACDDEVLGCIAFDFTGPSQGYGKCYTPPTSLDLSCAMTLGPSNVTTETCKQN